MMARYGGGRLIALLAVGTLLAGLPADGAVKPRTIIILPFDASGLDREEQWVGEGASQILALALAQHPAFVQIERTRVRHGRPTLPNERSLGNRRRVVAIVVGRLDEDGAQGEVGHRVGQRPGPVRALFVGTTW